MKLLSLARDLRRRKSRERQGLFAAEGVRTVEELLRSSLEVRGLLVDAGRTSDPRTARLAELAELRGVPVLAVSDAELRSATDTESPQGVVAVARVPARGLAALELPASGRLVVLDALQDPGNAGTIVRTAAAFGASATVALPGTVDLWNAKVVRSAMGAHFRTPPISCTAPELAAFVREREMPLWAADPAGAPLDGRPSGRVAIAIGNEGAGLGEAVLALAERRVSIPISTEVESLNAAVAAGILLHHLRA